MVTYYLETLWFLMSHIATQRTLKRTENTDLSVLKSFRAFRVARFQ